MALELGGGFLGSTVSHLTHRKNNLSPYLVTSASSVLLVADILCSVCLYSALYSGTSLLRLHVSSGAVCGAGSLLSPEVFELMMQFFRADT